jgi:site-specific DNA recombinase
MTRKKQDVPIAEAVIYLRVSTQEQADSGLGLANQLARARAYCAAQGWSVRDVYTDAGVSARTLDRPALRDAIAALAPGRVLLALTLSRLTRTARDLDVLTEQVAATGGAWETVEERFETRTATGRAMLRIVAVLAQLEREQTAERIVAALDVKRAKGERLGTTPLGYRTLEDGSVVEDEEGQLTVEIARQLRDSGLSYRAIARRLQELGRPTQRGGAWQESSVRRLCCERYLEACAAA